MPLPGRVPESSAVPPTAPQIPARKLALHATPVRRLHLENPVASVWSLSATRRALDLSVALLVLGVLGIPMLAVALCVRLSSPGPAFFTQYRVGRKGHLFRIYKFRSMTYNPAAAGPGLTRGGDLRVTRLGGWLRKLKVDELPQFYNILRGDMSIVGPRPKLPQYSAIRDMPYRPGITGAATLAFRREEEILSSIPPGQIDDFYHAYIQPLKARLDSRYMCRATLGSDLRVIGATAMACLIPARTPSALREGTEEENTAHIVSFPAPPAGEAARPNTAEALN